MNSYEEAVDKIIQEQQLIIGPLAIRQASKVEGILLVNGKAQLKGNGKEILNNLVSRYSEFFGQASIELCKDAVRDITANMSPDDIPDVLR
jgi:hypothetical protein